MIKIVHRVNTASGLNATSPSLGVEIDIRPYNNKLILNHEPYREGELLNKYLANFNHSFAILDLKVEWVAEDVIKMTEKYNIKNYFLLGVTIPETVSLIKKGFRKIAVRYSEWEPLEAALAFKDKVDWLWIDTFTKLPLDKKICQRIKKAGFKTCLVCPERWGRPEDIKQYKKSLTRLDFDLDAVMTGSKYTSEWASQLAS